MPSKPLFLYLASQSARRKEFLRKARLPFRLVRSAYIEKMVRKIKPARLVMEHALGKAREAKLPKGACYVLGADTLVVRKGKKIGKPKTRKEARRMLKGLAGKTHHVYTGVALWDRAANKVWTGYAKSKVKIKKMSDSEIRAYHQKVTPCDKAGAYAIQAKPFIVESIDGSYSNVVGLPMELLRKILKDVKRRSRLR